MDHRDSNTIPTWLSIEFIRSELANVADNVLIPKIWHAISFHTTEISILFINVDFLIYSFGCGVILFSRELRISVIIRRLLRTATQIFLVYCISTTTLDKKLFCRKLHLFFLDLKKKIKLDNFMKLLGFNNNSKNMTFQSVCVKKVLLVPPLGEAWIFSYHPPILFFI